MRGTEGRGATGAGEWWWWCGCYAGSHVKLSHRNVSLQKFVVHNAFSTGKAHQALVHIVYQTCLLRRDARGKFT